MVLRSKKLAAKLANEQKLFLLAQESAYLKMFEEISFVLAQKTRYNTT
jgi:hypothetical protein